MIHGPRCIIMKRSIFVFLFLFITQSSLGCLAAVGDSYICSETNSVRLRDHLFTEYELNSFSFSWQADKIEVYSKNFLEGAVYYINKKFTEEEFFTAELDGTSIISYEKGNFYFVQSGYYYAYAISAKCEKM